MSNAKYHRCRRALERLEASKFHDNPSYLEVTKLRRVVREYQAGGLRAKNGRGKGLHSSNARA